MANRKGKWYAVIQKLLANGAQLEFGSDPDHQAKVDILKTKIFNEEPRQASYYASQYVLLRKEVDELNEKLKDANLGIEAYWQLMYNQYEAEGIHLLHLQEGGSVSIQEEPKLKVTDPEKFRLWCIKEGLENKLQMHWATANSLLKQLLEAGHNPPEGTVAIPHAKPVWRKGKE